MRLLALMTLLPLFILVIALAVMLIPLPSFLPEAGSMARSRLAVAVAAPCFAAYFAIVIAYVVRTFARPGRRLDAAMTRLGLTGQPCGVFGRRYQGQIAGRQVKVSFQPARFPKHHLLNVYLDLSCTGQAAIGLSRPLLGCRSCPEIQFSEPSLANLRVFAGDESWVRAVMTDVNTQVVLLSLMQGDGWSSHNELYFRPGSLWLRAHPSVAGNDEAEWLGGLMSMAEAAESAPSSPPR